MNNEFTKTKKYKKFILVLVALLLFNFCYPKSVKAIDILGDISDLFFWTERGLIKLLNNIFTDKDHKYIYSKSGIIEDGVSRMEIRVKLTPESIIKGKFLLFNANIFKDESETESTNPEKYLDDASDKSTVSGRMELRKIVGGWYYALRNFAIVALLSVLVYVGIRMIISTVSKDKAKYKIMFKDWLVALCLLVLMHYIMIGILNVSQMIVDAIGSSGQASSQTERVMALIANINHSDNDDHEYTDGETGETYFIGDAYAYEVLLIVIIFYTGLFAIKYLKREFTIIFLILLGPISCITYPLDKISDGKAQAFNKWFSEFLYNVIIQPFHLLLYIVLVGSAVDLANDNLLYAIVCFAVMIPAEKFIKEMFGFRDKLGSPLGAMMAGGIASQLFNKAKGGSSGGKVKKDKDDGGEDLPERVKTTDLPGTEGRKQGTREALPERESGQGQGNSQSEGDETIRTRNLPEGDSGDGGDESDGADAVNTTDNPELEGGQDDGERNDSEEGADSEGINTQDGSDLEQLLSPDTPGEENNPEAQTNSNESNKSQGRWKRAIAAQRDLHHQRLEHKYGTTNIKELAKKRAWRATKSVGKWTGRRIKGAATLGTTALGMAAGGLLGMMMGRGKEGVALGAGLGRRIGTKVGSFADSAASKIGEYTKVGFNEFNDLNDKKKLEKYRKNTNNINRARRNFKDRVGRRATAEELDSELKNMFYLSQHGVQDSQIEDTMGLFYDFKKGGMDEETALNTAVHSARLAQDYGRKDFTDPKKMAEAYKNFVDMYAEKGFTEEQSSGYIHTIMEGGANLRGVKNIELPDQNKTIDVPITRRLPILNDLGIQYSQDVTPAQITAINNATIRLHDMGYSDADIRAFARSKADGKVKGGKVADSYVEMVNVAVEYMDSGEARRQASQLVESQNSGKVTDEGIREEMRERFVMKQVLEASSSKPVSEDDISAAREFETAMAPATGASKTDIQRARQFAAQYSAREMQSKDDMERAIGWLANDLRRSGKVNDRGIKKAKEIADIAAGYRGTTIAEIGNIE